MAAAAVDRLQEHVQAHERDVQDAEEAARTLIADYESLDLGRVKAAHESICRLSEARLSFKEGEARRDLLRERLSCLSFLASFQELRGGFASRLDRCLYVDLASEVVRAGEDAEWLLPTRASRQTTISRSVKPAIRDLSNRLCAAAQSHVSATVKFQGGKLVVQAGSRPGMALEALEMCKEGAGKARLDALLGDFWEWLNPVLCNTHIPDLSSDGLSLSPNVGTSTRTAKEILGGLGGAIEQLMSCLALPARLSAPAGAWLRGRLGSAAALVLIAGAPVESGEFAQFRDEAAGAARSLDARFEALSLGEGGGGVEEAVLGLSEMWLEGRKSCYVLEARQGVVCAASNVAQLLESVGEVGVAHQGGAGAGEAEKLQFPRCKITRLSRDLLGCLERAVEEARDGFRWRKGGPEGGACSGGEHVEGLCEAMLAATRDAVTVWCAVVEGSLLGRDWATDEEGEEGARVAPYAAVAIHNDAMWVSHQLTGLSLRWRCLLSSSRGGLSGGVCFADLAWEARNVGELALDGVLGAARRELQVIASRGVASLTTPGGPAGGFTEGAEMGVQTVVGLAEGALWELLPVHVYRRTVGGLADVWYSAITASVFALRDVPSRAVPPLQKFISNAKCDAALKRLTKEEQDSGYKVSASAMRLLVPSRDRLMTLCDLLDLTLVDLRSLIGGGALTHFTCSELTGLVKSLFEETAARGQVIRAIEEGRGEGGGRGRKHGAQV